jgi:orotate phosphoribosyltransferase
MFDYAKILLSTHALRVNVAEPFRWTSGILAPIYVDCRVVIGFPDQRRRLVDGLVELIESNIGVANFDVIAGGVTAGIPMASILAERLNKPLAYVRKEPKGHGKGQQVEGADVAGKRVLLFDELISRGSSVTAFCPALRAAGATLTDLLVMLSYDSDEVRAAAKDCNVKLHALLTLDEVLAATELSPEDRAEVARFRADPPHWRG